MGGRYSWPLVGIVSFQNGLAFINVVAGWEKVFGDPKHLPNPSASVNIPAVKKAIERSTRRQVIMQSAAAGEEL